MRGCSVRQRNRGRDQTHATGALTKCLCASARHRLTTRRLRPSTRRDVRASLFLTDRATCIRCWVGVERATAVNDACSRADFLITASSSGPGSASPSGCAWSLVDRAASSPGLPWSRTVPTWCRSPGRLARPLRLPEPHRRRMLPVEYYDRGFVLPQRRGFAAV